MTVQELIDELNKVQNKSVLVYVPLSIGHSLEATEFKIMNGKKRVLRTENYIEIGVVIK